jgi:hypothetical protein
MSSAGNFFDERKLLFVDTWNSKSKDREGALTRRGNVTPPLVHRRRVLEGAFASLFSAPSIIRAESLMPVKLVDWAPSDLHEINGDDRPRAGFVERLAYHWMDHVLRVGWTPERARPIFGGISESVMRRRVAYARRHGFLS